MKSINPLVYQLPDAEWQLRLHPHVVSYLNRYRQTCPQSKEAGGQLYSPSMTAKQVEITGVSGPYPGDRRSRYQYTMQGEAATRDRMRFFEDGHRLCGLWHTHPEPKPSPSEDDLQAVRDNLVLLPEWDALLLVIQGTRPNPEGLFVGVYHREQGLKPLALLCES